MGQEEGEPMAPAPTPSNQDGNANEDKPPTQQLQEVHVNRPRRNPARARNPPGRYREMGDV